MFESMFQKWHFISNLANFDLNCVNIPWPHVCLLLVFFMFSFYWFVSSSKKVVESLNKDISTRTTWGLRLWERQPYHPLTSVSLSGEQLHIAPTTQRSRCMKAPSPQSIRTAHPMPRCDPNQPWWNLINKTFHFLRDTTLVDLSPFVLLSYYFLSHW